MELRGARILLTGGTTGVGAALVQTLDDAGARLVTCGANPGRCADLAVRHPAITVLQTDLAAAGAARRLVDDAVTALGGLDVVINNAAIQVLEQYVNPSPGIDTRIERELAVNLRAPVEITAASVPHLAEAPRGVLVFVTSGLAIFPKKTAPVYCATKSGLRTFATAIRYQLTDDAPGVRVVDVVLPMVDTPMTAGRGSDGSKMPPDAVARRVVQALDGRRGTVRVGKASILPLFERLAPAVGRRILRDG